MKIITFVYDQLGKQSKVCFEKFRQKNNTDEINSYLRRSCAAGVCKLFMKTSEICNTATG